MANAVPREDDYGFAIVVTLVDMAGAVVDISAASTLSLIIRKPDRTFATKTATFVTDGSDGMLQWTVTDGYLDQEGHYAIEAEVSDGSTFTYRSSMMTMEVGGKIE